MNAKVKQAMFALNDDLKSSIQSNSIVVVNRNDLKEVVDHLFHGGDEWSNQSALGYAIVAAESIDLDFAEISHLVSAMNREFDEKTLDTAAEVYRKSDY